MAYKEFWRPIQGAINNLNRQINVNADRESQRQAQGLKKTMAIAGVEDQFQQRVLQKKQHQLAVESGLRADRQLNMEREAMTDRQKREELQDEQNQMDWAYKNMVQGKVMADMRYSREKKPFSAYSVFPNSQSAQELLWNKPAFVSGLEEAIGGTFNRKQGQFIGSDGKVKNLSNEDIDRVMPDLVSHYVMNTDIVENYKAMNSALDKNIASINGKLKNEFLITDKAKLKRDKAVLQSKKTAIDKKTTDSELTTAYRNKYNTLMGLRLKTANPRTSEALDTAMKHTSGIIEQLMENQAKSAGASGAAWKNATSKIAMITNDDGNVIKTLAMDVPKDGKSYEPADLDKSLEGKNVQWKEGVEFQTRQEGDAYNSGLRELNRRYSKGVDAENQFIIDPEKQKENEVASSVYGRLMKKSKYKKNFIAAVNESATTAQVALSNYNRLVYEYANKDKVIDPKSNAVIDLDDEKFQKLVPDPKFKGNEITVANWTRREYKDRLDKQFLKQFGVMPPGMEL